MQASLCPLGGGIRASTLHASTDPSLASLPLGRATRLRTNDLEAIQACCICPLCMVASCLEAGACMLVNAVPPALASPLLLSVLLHGPSLQWLGKAVLNRRVTLLHFPSGAPRLGAGHAAPLRRAPHHTRGCGLYRQTDC